MFTGKKFGIEHALNMFALSHVTMPAFAIYEEEILEQFRENLKTCHIYLVGTLPKVVLEDARQEGQELVTAHRVNGEVYELRWPLDVDCHLVSHEQGWTVENGTGERRFPGDELVIGHLSHKYGIYDFNILYIGQAYGQDGSRNALDRLLKHETLQKISLKGIPEGQVLSLLLLEIEPGNRMITAINPFAEDTESGPTRIAAGLDKLFGTNEAERITLYEASLIRYFQPPYNKEFKNSFPSTNLKVLKDCYDKDFSAVIAEISIDSLPFRLFSSTVSPRWDHIASFDLHEDEARKVFFST